MTISFENDSLEIKPAGEVEPKPAGEVEFEKYSQFVVKLASMGPRRYLSPTVTPTVSYVKLVSDAAEDPWE
jgi:hypothetical protein